MNKSPPTSQQPRRRQSRRAEERRLSQSMTASAGIRRNSSLGGGGHDSVEPDEMTWLINNRSSQQQRIKSSRLSVSFSSFNYSYNAINEEVEGVEDSKKMNQNESTTTNDMLITTLKAATEHIFGLYAVEVWRFDERIDLLQSLPLEFNAGMENDDNIDDEENPSRPQNTLYIRRKPQESDEASPSFQVSAKEAYEQLTDTSHSDHLSQSTTQPGVGLAGLLWSEATQLRNDQHLSRMRKQQQRNGSLTQSDVEHSEDNVIDTTLQWRHVDDLASDPDQTYDERLLAFGEAGFHLATAVPFDIFHFRGMVVFFGNPHAEECKLNSPNNVRMIQYAAQAIGSIAAMRYENAETVRVKKRMYKKNWSLLKAKILTAVRFQSPIRRDALKIGSDINGGKSRRQSFFSLGSLVISMQNDGMQEGDEYNSSKLNRLKTCIGTCGAIMHEIGSEAMYRIHSKTVRWQAKLQGGHSPLPPSMSSDQVIFTFFGTLIAHSLLSAFHYSLRDYAGGIVVGPLGALTTLQYNLTAAPASQPRNSFFSQILTFLVVLVLHWCFPSDNQHPTSPDFNVYVRTTLAPVIVISTTAWLGIIHPPAGAAAVAFAAREHLSLRYSSIFLVEISITILVAVLVNNFSDKRTYPTGWPILRWIITHLRTYWHVATEYVSVCWDATKAICPIQPKLTPGEVFNRIDKDGNGLLSKKEIVEAIQLLAEHGALDMDAYSPMDLATKYICKADSNHDGYVDMEEFEASILAYSTRKSNIDAARNAFQVIDINGDGVLDKYEVAKAIEMMISKQQMTEVQLKGKTPLQTAEKMIQECDEDGGGELDMEEFTNMMYKFF